MIVKHICFFYIEERIKYINRIIHETNTYNSATDIFIHTNNNTLTKDSFDEYTNGTITIVYHDLSNIHPFYLSWKCRDLLKKQRDDYDIFIYVEDDILIPKKAIEYWLKYNEKLIDLNYNLGFIRIEVDHNNIEYMTDIICTFNKFVQVDNEKYCVNDVNPYCAFWIYNKNEFNRFVNSEYYDIQNIKGYNTREMSAIGLHGLQTSWYKNTLIPIQDDKLSNDCRVYHMPNNYINLMQYRHMQYRHMQYRHIQFTKCIL
jgi:hypothetical protein